MSAPVLDPIDSCGCGDTGYLTTRSLPIDLAHGVGTVHNVPIYHCQNPDCHDYTLPSSVSRRLEEIAEAMELDQSVEKAFSWPKSEDPSTSLDPLRQANTQESILQAFTLQLTSREYEGGKVMLVIPGQAVFIQSKDDREEYFALRYEPDISLESIHFSFSKFYTAEPLASPDDFLSLEKEGQTKELAVLKMEDIEEALTEVLGEY